MPRGGKRDGAGRKKRTNLKNLVEISPAIAIVKGLSKQDTTTEQLPLDYMLAVMRDRTAEWKRRDDMAKAAAPFCHAKVSERPAGKKAREEEAAKLAGLDDDWGDDLRPN